MCLSLLEMNYLTSMQSGKSVMELSPIKIDESETSLTRSLASSIRSTALSTFSETSVQLSSHSITSSESESESSISTPSSLSSSSSSDFDMLSLVTQINNMDEEILLKTHGYCMENEISTTTQGELFLARNGEEFVVIKKIAKDLYQRKEFVSNNFTFSTDKSIVNEAMILKSIAENKNPKNELILKYIDSFESDEHYYLVQEYIEDSITLKEFVIKAHQYITENKLKLKHYQKIMKYLYWQLIVTINWMHNDMNCVHLDIVTDNIMVKNAEFTLGSDGYYTINSNIQIKLTDFGVAEIYELNNNNNNNFSCIKYGLSLDNEAYVSPQIYNH
eukprot:40653_1